MSTPVDIKSAAKQLGISVQRTRTLCRQGKLPAAKIANSWLISQADLIKFGMKSGHM
ncbi:MAG: helix-turn-helix domain-containing protein, partial [Desulfuromonadales bacterium]|nr:helix-turn-helix domain-containing protein [Desulfuromonadales bacterium]